MEAKLCPVAWQIGTQKRIAQPVEQRVRNMESSRLANWVLIILLPVILCRTFSWDSLERSQLSVDVRQNEEEFSCLASQFGV